MALPSFTTLSGKTRAGIAAVVLLAVGGTAGVVAGHALEPSVEMAPMRPVALRTLAASNDRDAIVTVRGRVAEVFGNKFIADDGTGRALVDLGRAGDDAALVAAGQTVGVQGRYDRGTLRASFLVDAAGKVTSLRPAGPGGPGGDKHRGPHRRGDRDGRDGRDGPDGGPDGAREGRTPPAPVAGQPAAAPASAPIAPAA